MGVSPHRPTAADEASFDTFVRDYDRRLWQALAPIAGPDVARDAATDALVYAWRHWHRVAGMENPHGYVYAIARRAAQKRPRPLALLPAAEPVELPSIDPGLRVALSGLTEMQRTVVYLVDGCGWGLTEAADVLGVSLSTLRNHRARGLAKLRQELEVSADV